VRTTLIELQECPAPPVARQRIATALPQCRPDWRMVETMSRPGSYSGPTPRLQRLTRTRPKVRTGDQAGP
jgi:hypothetical protein